MKKNDMVGGIKSVRIWLGIKFRTLLLSFLLALSNIETQFFRNVGRKMGMGGGVITKMLIRSTLLDKMFQGKHDEKYVQEFYEILRKADNFMKKTTPHKIGVSADTYAKTYGKKDKHGRRYEHFGFFDEKHKYYGKTLEEVFQIELEERRTKDDNYELIMVINNKPVDVGLSQIMDVVDSVKDRDGTIKHIFNNSLQKSKQHKFPIKIARKNEACLNKIEELAEFLHIKHIAFEKRRFEFFIPLKYGTINFNETSNVFKDLINVDEIFTKNDYGELTGYGVDVFVKRFLHNNMYDVFRFDGYEMEKIGTY